MQLEVGVSCGGDLFSGCEHCLSYSTVPVVRVRGNQRMTGEMVYGVPYTHNTPTRLITFWLGACYYTFGQTDLLHIVQDTLCFVRYAPSGILIIVLQPRYPAP
jgi:hypothetical protein